MSLAEFAVFLGFHSFRMVFLFLHHVIVSLLALGACPVSYTHLDVYKRQIFSYVVQISLYRPQQDSP